jgi:hypothetical protein
MRPNLVGSVDLMPENLLEKDKAESCVHSLEQMAQVRKAFGTVGDHVDDMSIGFILLLLNHISELDEDPFTSLLTRLPWITVSIIL